MDEQKHTAIMDAGECLDHKTLLAYQAGSLSAAQNHQVEKHLLDCELCSEALEGLAGTEPAQVEEAVADLQARAWQRVAEIEKRRRRGAWIWMSSSAAAVLLVAILFFTRSTPGTLSEENVAFKKAFDPNPKAGMSAAEADSAGTGTLAMEYKSSPKADMALPNQTSDGPMNEFGQEELEPVQPPGLLENSNISTMPEKWAEDLFKLEERQSKPDVNRFYKDKNTDFSSGDVKSLERSEDPRTGNQLFNSTFRDLADGDDVEQQMEDPSSDFDDAAADEVFSLESEKPVVADSTSANVDVIITSGSATTLSNNGLFFSSAPTGNLTYSWTVPLPSDATAPLTTNLGAVEVITSSENNRSRKEIAQKAKNAATPAMRNRRLDDAGYRANSGWVGTPMGAALDLHYAQKFSEAAQGFRSILETAPDNQEARLYLGIDLLATGQPVPALTQLNEVIAKGDARQAEDATWYKALVFVQLKDRIHGQPLLEKIEEEGGRYAANATALLAQLQW